MPDTRAWVGSEVGRAGLARLRQAQQSFVQQCIWLPAIPPRDFRLQEPLQEPCKPGSHVADPKGGERGALLTGFCCGCRNTKHARTENEAASAAAVLLRCCGDGLHGPPNQ